MRSSLFWQTAPFTCQQCAAVVCTFCVFIGMHSFPELSLSQRIIWMIGIVPKAPSFNLLNSRSFASLALYTAPFLLSDMPFRKGQFYGVIKKVYLKLWNCRSQDRTNCSLHSLVTVEVLFAQATYPLQSAQDTFAPQKTSWETPTIRQESFKRPNPRNSSVYMCMYALTCAHTCL